VALLARIPAGNIGALAPAADRPSDARCSDHAVITTRRGASGQIKGRSAMAFEHLSTEDLIRIAQYGGGFTLDAHDRSTEDLIRIAQYAASSAARIVFRGLGSRKVEDLIRIAQYGKGVVAFEN